MHKILQAQREQMVSVMSRTFTHHEEQERDDDAPGDDADDGEGLHTEQVEAAAPVDAL